MNRPLKYLVVVGLAAALCVAATALVGCNGKGGGNRPPRASAQAYVCESCGHKFGIPLTTPVKKQIFPPIVCPECGKRTAVRAIIYRSKETGEPVIYEYTKYTDEQIKRMEQYRDEVPEKQLMAEPPEMMLQQYDNQSATIKYHDDGGWFVPDPTGQTNQRRVRPFDEIRKRFKSAFQVFPKDWKTYDIDDLKQR